MTSRCTRARRHRLHGPTTHIGYRHHKPRAREFFQADIKTTSGPFEAEHQLGHIERSVYAVIVRFSRQGRSAVTDPCTSSLGDEDRGTLIQVARNAISHELYQHVPMEVDVDRFALALRQTRAAFVTLRINSQLRGCIGTLEAHQPLVLDVARNAAAAAFADRRFPRLTRDEFRRVNIHISILSPPEPIDFASEADLLGQLRPGVDGLILTELTLRGTFLPDVWHEVREAQQFLQHLKMKAGLPADYWSDTIRIERYTTESIP